MLSRGEGDPRAKNKLPHCLAEVASHEAVQDRVDGGVGVTEQQGEGEEFYVFVNAQVEE
jgi:hypothetical protein